MSYGETSEGGADVDIFQAGSGNVIGSRFAELGDIIEQVDDKTRVGVCLDTCEFLV